MVRTCISNRSPTSSLAVPGNSLTRWLAVLRLGTSSGRATFLWFSDRPLARSSSSADAPGEAKLAGRRLKEFRLAKWQRPRPYLRAHGFDLGDYFVGVDADYRWSRAAYRRVREAMLGRNVSAPMLVNYRCVKHTWACMQPMLEYGPLGPPAKGDPANLDGGFAREPERVTCTHEDEKDGFMVSWLASRTEPWILLRLNEQTALEPSGPAAAAVLSGAWPAAASAAAAAASGSAFWYGRRYATHACGACLKQEMLGRLRAKPGELAFRTVSASGECVVDSHPSRSGWRPGNRPTDPEQLRLYLAAAQPPFARGMRALRRLRRGARTFAFAGACEAYSVLRPRRWLQRAMLPQLRKLSAAMNGGPLIGLHLRSGFADWQWYSSTHSPSREAKGRTSANTHWSAALTAGPMDYAEHWRGFESMLHDCKEDYALSNPDKPCFQWRSPTIGHSPELANAADCARNRLASQAKIPRLPAASSTRASPSRGLFALSADVGGEHEHRTCLPVSPHVCMWSLPLPTNGTLASVIECAHRFARALSRPEEGALLREGDPWAVFTMGDAPGFMSLVHSLPALAGRVVHTSDAGGIAHTTFSGSCPHGSSSCLRQGTVDPQGGWTRAMIDYYLGGLTDGFVSSLFSSFVGAVLRRSMTCCKERYHFGAMYSQQRSHRDKPMRHVDFLRALMQASEQRAAETEWN